MVKIIRHGIKHMGNINFVCFNCKCIFETDDYIIKTAKGNSEYDALYATCPECNSIVCKAWT